LVSAAFFLEYLKCVLEWKGLEVLEEKALKVLEFCRTFGVGTLPLVYLVHHMYQLYKKTTLFSYLWGRQNLLCEEHNGMSLMPVQYTYTLQPCVSWLPL